MSATVEAHKRNRGRPRKFAAADFTVKSPAGEMVVAITAAGNSVTDVDAALALATKIRTSISKNFKGHSPSAVSARI